MKRKAIILDNETVAIISIFTKQTTSSLNIWLFEIDECQEENYNVFENSAKEFINQFGDHYAPLFLMNLAKQCIKRLKKDDIICQSNHANETIKEIIKEYSDEKEFI